MARMTFSISDDLKEEIDRYPWVDWSEVVLTAFREKIKEMDLMILEDFKSKSELTEEDALRLGKEVNRSLYKRYKESS